MCDKKDTSLQANNNVKNTLETYNLHNTRRIVFRSLKGKSNSSTKIMDDLCIYPSKKLKSCYEDLFTNLIQAYSSGNLGMIFSFNRDYYKESIPIGDKLFKSKIYYAGAMKWVKLLEDLGWVVVIKGKKNFKDNSKTEIGRLIFDSNLYLFMSQYKTEDLKLNKTVSCSVRLKVEGENVKIKRNLIHVKDSEKFLDYYNEWIKGWNVSIDSMQINCDSYRLFIGDEESYGRVHSGYQNMKSELRKDILIGGSPTKELDLTACHLYILYAMEMFDISGATMYDYQQINDFTDDMREIECGGAELTYNDVKIMLMIMINSKSRESALKAILSNERFDKFGKDRLVFNIFIDCLESLHERISHYFYSNMSLLLMFKESSYLLDVVKELTNTNIPSLFVHDSIIVREEDVSVCNYVMTKKFKEHFNINPEIKVK